MAHKAPNKTAVKILKALLLNPRGEIISIETVSVGELTSTLVHPREVFSQAVKRSAAGIVFVHNHPSGNPEPSEEDIKTTERLAACGKLLGIVTSRVSASTTASSRASSSAILSGSPI